MENIATETDEKAKRLADARCKDAETALVKILGICRDENIDCREALARVELIAVTTL